MYMNFYKTPWFYIILQSNEKYLLNVDFSPTKPKIIIKNNAILDIALHELDLYFHKKLQIFKTPLLINGSLFEQKVYNALLKIPYGQTKSYQEIATIIGHNNAYRAVGNANAKNKLAIFIPCHRVVAKNHLGGYNGGIEIKKRLLKLEELP